MIVVKFGGTSLAGTERMRAAARIVAAARRDSSVVCVVSALAGVTDTLLRITEQVTTGGMTGTTTGMTTGATTTTALTDLRTRHQRVLTALTTTASTPELTSFTTRFATLWSTLEADLERLHAMPNTPAEVRAQAIAAFSGWGERLAVLLFSAALADAGMPASAYDGEPVILAPRAVSSDDATSAPPRPWERLAPSVAATRAATAAWAHGQLAAGRVPVLPGYLGRTLDGLVTILGRNGSDYSAAVLAAALRADTLTIYSDVAGLYRADPHIVPDAESLPALTYADAAEIAALGARVLHPATLRPLAATGIPLRLRSAFTPDAPGTDIGCAASVRDRLGDREAWVVAARPLQAEQPLFGFPTEWTPGLVEVAGVFLSHADLPACEDDHLALPASTRYVKAPYRASDGPFSGALDLLAAAPRPVGLALSGRRLSVAVPSGESTAMQRRMYAALSRATQPGNTDETGACELTERRRTS